jgi:hypothetical protein
MAWTLENAGLLRKVVGRSLSFSPGLHSGDGDPAQWRPGALAAPGPLEMDKRPW